MRSTRRMLFTCLALLVLVPAMALGNGLYSPSVGVRAAAMGGAFIGLADDYSAVYWNPAGITQIKGMEVTVTGADVASMASRDGLVRFEGLPGAEDGFRYALGEIAATSQGTFRGAPGIFFYTDPGPARGIVDKVGFAAYTLTEFGSRWKGADLLDGFVQPADYDQSFAIVSVGADAQDYESRIRNYTLSPIVAKEVVPGLSVGLAGNFTYGHFKLQDVLMVQTVVDYQQPGAEDRWILSLVPLRMSDDVTAWGYGATLGALYRVNRRASVGLTVRSPMTMSYEGQLDFYLSATTPDTSIVYEEHHKDKFDLRYPTWAGLGVAYRDFLFDGLTTTVDVQWTDWSTFESINRVIDEGANIPSEEEDQIGDVTHTALNWEDTVEVALGFDYRLGRTMSLHLGYRNSPSPVPDSTYDFVMPMTAKNVVTLGATMRQDYWRASLSLEYQAGTQRNISGTYEMNGKQVEDAFIPSLSFTYAF
jgi:long-chain fatty acid transport protein